MLGGRPLNLAPSESDNTRCPEGIKGRDGVNNHGEPLKEFGTERCLDRRNQNSASGTEGFSVPSVGLPMFLAIYRCPKSLS